MAWKEKSLFWRSESPTAVSDTQEGVSTGDNDATVKQAIQTGELTLEEAAHGACSSGTMAVATTAGTSTTSDCGIGAAISNVDGTSVSSNCGERSVLCSRMWRGSQLTTTEGSLSTAGDEG